MRGIETFWLWASDIPWSPNLIPLSFPSYPALPFHRKRRLQTCWDEIWTLMSLFAHVEKMLAMCHFSWRKKRINLESSRNKTGGRKDNKLLTSRNGKQITKDRKTTLLATICAARKHQSPCQPKQLWECVIMDGRYRLRKCRKIGPTTPAPPTPSAAHTTPVKMCVCVKQSLEQEDQGRLIKYEG